MRWARGRSYFLSDLLAKVMFPEAALAGRDPLTEARRRRLRLVILAAGAAVVVLLTLAWGVGYVANARLIHMLAERSTKLQSDVRALPGGDVSDSDLSGVLPVLDEARTLPFSSTAPKALRGPGFSFGVGQAGARRPQVDAAYRGLLDRLMLPRLILGVEDRMRTLVAAPESAGDQRAEIYALLRVYLMLGRAQGAPMQRDQIEGWFAERWSEQWPGQEDDGLRADLAAHLHTLLAGRLQPPALDGALIASARAAVSSLSPGERAYSRMLGDPALAALPQYSLMDAPGVGSSGLFARRSGKPLSAGVPGMFRRGAFYGPVLAAIGKAAAASADDSWVLGTPSEGSPLSETGRTKDGLLVAYLSDFTRRWDGFIDDIAVSGRYPPDERVRRALQPPSPFKLLIESLATETDLTPPHLNTRSGGGLAGAALRTSSLFSRRIYSGMNRANQVAMVNSGQPPSPSGSAGRRGRALPLAARPAAERRRRAFAHPTTALSALKDAADSSLAAKAAGGMGDPLLQHEKTSGAMAATAKLQQVSHAKPRTAQRTSSWRT